MTPSTANKEIRIYLCCGTEKELRAALPSVIKLNRRCTKAHANNHSLYGKSSMPLQRIGGPHQCVTTGLDACMIITVMLISGDGLCLPIQSGDEERHKRSGVVPGHKTQITLANTTKSVFHSLHSTFF